MKRELLATVALRQGRPLLVTDLTYTMVCRILHTFCGYVSIAIHEYTPSHNSYYPTPCALGGLGVLLYQCSAAISLHAVWPLTKLYERFWLSPSVTIDRYLTSLSDQTKKEAR